MASLRDLSVPTRWICFFQLLILMSILSSNLPYSMHIWLLLFDLDYYRLIVQAISFWTYYADLPSEKSAILPSDCTVILPTVFGKPADILECIRSILANGPKEVLVVVEHSKLSTVEEFCGEHGLPRVRVYSVPVKGKRIQMAEGLKHVITPFVSFADDDVIWPPKMLPLLLAPLENSNVGGAGPQQRTIRKEEPSIWNILGIAYLERRNFNTGGTNHIDGGISTLSGRTSVYRAEILKSDDFEDCFLHEMEGGVHITAGDDKFLTMYLKSHGWDIKLQFDENAVLLTTQEEGKAYLSQCMRWARSHWLGNLKTLKTRPLSSYWPRVWEFYVVYVGSFLHFSIIGDVLLATVLHRGLCDMNMPIGKYRLCTGLFWVWTLASKQVKMLGHYRRYPQDLNVKFVIGQLIFSYLHTFINLWALITYKDSSWGAKASTTVSATIHKSNGDSTHETGAISDYVDSDFEMALLDLDPAALFSLDLGVDSGYQTPDPETKNKSAKSAAAGGV